ncbi:MULTISPECIES: A24 family peptidase [Agrobacterium]|uniref:Peptidase n=2 Tax=Agrobacterium TaxID=357 RepID=A0A4D7YN56_AGRTU|nr:MULTISPECIES: prepilin peptidase [Agrobacterium]QCL95146.1 peptidase [Agrobacterium tumefaciens]CUX34577.1 Prepilin peptidase, component of type IV pilus [Agrobacterium deltaense Zutra 3/1]
MIIAAIFLIAPFCFALAAFTDLLSMSIPNRIPAFMLLSFLIIAPFSGLSWESIGMSVVASILVFLACFGLFLTNTMGGGDAKLMTAAAAWYGFNVSLIEFLLAVSLAGGLLTVMILVLRSRSQEILIAGLPIPDSLLMTNKIPYGIGIAIAGFLTYGETPIVNMALVRLS